MNNTDFFESTPVKYGESAVKVVEFSFTAGAKCFITHWHERMEILRILNGEMSVTLGTKSITAYSGDVVIIPPKTIHAGTAITNCNYTAIMFDIRSFFNKTKSCDIFMNSLLDGRAIFKSTSNNKEIIKTVDEICEKNDNGIDGLKVIAGIYSLLAQLYESCLVEYVPESNNGNIISEVKKYIENNLQNEITTVELSRHFGYTVPYFCKKFKIQTGLSPLNYLKICRLEKAYSLITERKYKISEIAGMCGFEDSNYFTRCFTSHFGNPPTYYTKSAKNLN